LAPVDNLSVCVMSILSTERRPADLTLKHDRTKTPPVAILSVTMSAEDLWCDVVWSANRGICHNTSRLAPIVNYSTVTNSEIDLIEIDRVAITRSAGFSLKKVLII